MGGVVRVLVNQFMQGGRRRHRIQQQYQADQQNGQRRFVEAIQLGFYVLQTICNIANDLPPASDILFEGAARAALKSGNISDEVAENQIHAPAHAFLESGTSAIAGFALAASPGTILALDGAA